MRGLLKRILPHSAVLKTPSRRGVLSDEYTSVPLKHIRIELSEGFSETTGGTERKHGGILYYDSRLSRPSRLRFTEEQKIVYDGVEYGNSKSKTASSTLSAVTSGVRAAASRLTGLRSGKDYVPYDEYPALLHKGEAVLTAGENEALERMGGVEGVAGLAAARQPSVNVENRIEMTGGGSAPQDINLSVELDGYQLAKAVGKATNELSRQLNARVIKQ